jgi:hypothetical protein
MNMKRSKTRFRIPASNKPPSKIYRSYFIFYQRFQHVALRRAEIMKTRYVVTNNGF